MDGLQKLPLLNWKADSLMKVDISLEVFKSKPPFSIFGFVFCDRIASLCNSAEKTQSGLLAKLEKSQEWKGLSVVPYIRALHANIILNLKYSCYSVKSKPPT
jgi:hypothetical protein